MFKKIKKFIVAKPALLVAVAFVVIGVALLATSRADTLSVVLEAENGTLSGNQGNGTTAGASGRAVRFGVNTVPPTPPPNPPPTPPTAPPPAPPPSTPGTAKYPADIFGPLWKVTLPVVSGGKVVEIKPPEIATYSDKYMKLNATKDGVVFTVYHGGGTTSNSSNPRSELRERYNNDPEGYWKAGTGTHTMEVTGQVNRLTKVKPHVVIAQVHDDSDDVSVWRVEANKLWLTNGNSTHGFLVDGNFQLGKKYTLKYVITNGNYEYYYNGQKVNYTLKNSNPSYFKAGNYLQSNPSSAPGESSSEYSEVVLYSVKVTHS